MVIPVTMKEKRYILAALAFFSTFNVYSIRNGITISIMDMANIVKESQSGQVVNASIVHDITVCPFPNVTHSTNKSNNISTGYYKEITWSEKQKGDILGAYFIGYSFAQVPAAWAGRRFGTIRILTIGFVIASLMMLGTPLMTNAASNSTMAFNINFTSRIIIGLVQSGTYPLLVGLWGKWSPKRELSRLIAIQFAGSGFGTFIILPIVTQMTRHLGWESGFYLVGAVGLLCAALLHFFAFDSPDKHPTISPEELSLLMPKDEAETLTSQPKKDVPWFKIATSLPLWAIIIAHFSSNYGSYVLQNYLPSYLKKQLHYDLGAAGYISSIPNLLKVIITLVAGFISDFLVNQKGLSNPGVRRIMTTIGLTGPAIAMFLSGFIGCQKVVIIVLLMIALSFDGFTTAGFKSNHNELSPEFSGILFGITNTLGNLPGFIGTATAGRILDSMDGLTGWRTIFSLGAAIYVIGNAVFLIFGRFTVQPWN